MSINTKLEQIAILKEEALQEILSNTDLSKVEKLSLISNENLLEVDTYINGLFDEWELECAKEEERLAIEAGLIKGKDYICSITDATLIEHYDRHEIIYYDNLLAYLEPLEDEDGEENVGKILVARCRGDFGASIYKTPEEIIDYIYNYAIESKSIGFELDW